MISISIRAIPESRPILKKVRGHGQVYLTRESGARHIPSLRAIALALVLFSGAALGDRSAPEAVIRLCPLCAKSGHFPRSRVPAVPVPWRGKDQSDHAAYGLIKI